MKNNTKKNIIIITLIIILTALSYINTLNNSFVYDDNTYVVENRQIRSASNIPKAFISSYPPDSKEQGLYRPMVAISYIFDYAFRGLNPKSFHLTNLILHILTSIIVYLLAFEIIKTRWPSAVVGIVFALHPVHTEAVTWVVGRAEVMAGLFYFLAFLLYIKTGEFASLKNRLFIFSIASYFFALLSKEMAVTLPILLFIYDYYFALKTPLTPTLSHKGRGNEVEPLPQGEKGHFFMKKVDSPPLMGGDKGEGVQNLNMVRLFIKRYLPYIFVTLIYIIIRYAVLGAFGPQKNLYFTPDIGLYERFLTIIVVIGYYIRILFLPLSLTVDYVFPKIASLNLPVLIYGGMLIFSLIIISFSYKMSKRLSFAILFFYITLLPVSNIMPIGELIAERFLYIPLISFALLIGISIDYFFIRFSSRFLRIIISISLILLAAFYSLATISRNYDWKDAFTLWKSTIYTMPASSVAHNNLGIEYAKKEEHVDAIKEYKKAIELSPKYSHALTNLGDAYLKIGLTDEAIDFYKKAIEAEPDYSIAYNNLGFAYFEKRLYKEALAEYKKAIELNSKDPLFYNNLGNLSALMKRYDDAISEYKRAISIDPFDTNAYNNLGAVYAQQGKFNEAEAEVRKALAIDPESSLAKKTLEDILNRGRIVVETESPLDKKGGKSAMIAAYNELGNKYKQKGLYDDAISSYKMAIQIEPKDAGSHYNLGSAYVKKDMYQEAAIETENALKLDPKMADAHRNLGLIYYLYLKDNKKAVYHFKKLLQLAPNQSDADNIKKIIKETKPSLP
ncbi:MAG: tetratricopeptide repeat protein [Nitrospirae bacterium]|nr:tetratricopeptide repeat protein [Nitrospirota bacterium]